MQWRIKINNGLKGHYLGKGSVSSFNNKLVSDSRYYQHLQVNKRNFYRNNKKEEGIFNERCEIFYL